jgi:hypothetical protein
MILQNVGNHTPEYWAFDAKIITSWVFDVDIFK